MNSFWHPRAPQRSISSAHLRCPFVQSEHDRVLSAELEQALWHRHARDVLSRVWEHFSSWERVLRGWKRRGDCWGEANLHAGYALQSQGPSVEDKREQARGWDLGEDRLVQQLHQSPGDQAAAVQGSGSGGNISGNSGAKGGAHAPA